MREPKIQLHNMDCLEYMRGLEDNSFDLIIVDPPYFEVKGEFDFKWKSFSDYLADVELWAREMARVLKKSGSLYWYGHAKKIAHSQVVIDKYLNLENSLVWFKYDSQTNKGVEEFRSYAPVTERILFYSKEIERTGLEEIKLDIENFKPLRDYFESMQKFIGLGLKKINDQLGHRKAEHCFYWGSTQWGLPTVEVYNDIIRVFGVGSWSGFVGYEELRVGYEELRRPFNNELKLTDVMRFSQEAHITGRHDHPTQKPPKLSQALAMTSGKTGGRAFIPFVGSGTEFLACINQGMKVEGCELDEGYFKAAKQRIADETAQAALF